jgi:Protein of unknown function (DUF3052)
VAGYSQSPLWRKLGVREGGELVRLRAPGDFELGELPPGVEPKRTTRVPRAGGAPAPTILAFQRSRRDLVRSLPALARAAYPDGAVWIAWPRRAGGGVSDIRESDIREAALPLGLVDVKVAALAEHWSGLRLVWRRTMRGTDERRGDAPPQPRG